MSFTIRPKDRRAFKSSRVREYYKLLNAILDPYKTQILNESHEATVDALIYGTGFINVGMDKDKMYFRCRNPVLSSAPNINRNHHETP